MLQNPSSSRREDLAWLAGFFDGEGCVHCHQYDNAHNTVRIVLRVAQNAFLPETLDKIYRITGRGNFHTHHSRRGRENPITTWTAASFEDVQYVMASIWPWLSDIKKQKYIDSIHLWRKSKPWIRKVRGPSGIFA